MGSIQTSELLQIALYFAVLMPAAYFLAAFMEKIFTGDTPWALRWLRPVENISYKLGGVDPKREMPWRDYVKALLIFNGVGLAVLFAILSLQHLLPLNPQKIPAMNPYLALNTAISFATNTNWQAYSGEAALSYFSQALGLCVQNFLSAAAGIAVLVALARGLRNRGTDKLGNFWSDLTRATIYVLLPLSLILAFVLVGQGVVQNLSPYVASTTLEGATQVIPGGPAASQIAIKQLGTNGGGFFGVNSAHPFENPTPFSNFLQLLAILLLPVSCVFVFGRLLKERSQGHALLATMFMIFVPLLALALWAESGTNPALGNIPFLEGKEVRFGVGSSTLWAAATTAASNGSVNAMHDSFSPLGGMVALFNIMMGEVIFGGVGTGLYGIVLFVVLTVFLAGLMVGRSPEYLGKKIESYEVTWAAIGVLVPCFLILVGSALAASTDWGLKTLNNAGPHGLSEILYAFSSAAGNNGSAFAGLGVDTPFYNLALGLCMVLGRYVPIVAILAIAGSLGLKRTAPVTAGTFPTNTSIFSVLLAGVILVVGALTFFPALALGPIADHLLMLQGKLF